MVKALEEKDFTHAAHHLAAAVGLDPADPPTMGGRAVPRACEDAAALVATDMFHGALIARGALLGMDSGETTEAVRLMLLVQDAMPDLRYVETMRRWLTTDEQLAEIAKWIASSIRASLPLARRRVSRAHAAARRNGGVTAARRQARFSRGQGTPLDGARESRHRGRAARAARPSVLHGDRPRVRAPRAG